MKKNSHSLFNNVSSKLLKNDIYTFNVANFIELNIYSIKTGHELLRRNEIF